MPTNRPFQSLPTGPDDANPAQRQRLLRGLSGEIRQTRFSVQKVVDMGKQSLHVAVRKYKKASTGQKLALWGFVVVNIALIGAIIIITPHRILQAFADMSGWLRNKGLLGMFICYLLVVLASHPPLFGFASSMTLIGFTFGLWPGILIAVLASMSGAGFAFWSIRTFFLSWMRKFGSGKSDKWEAFGHVIRAKGTILIIMIRWCPLPWALSNGMLASISEVRFSSFMIANLLLQPRLMIPVFIGSRLESLTEPGPPDPVRKWVNIGGILMGIALSFGTGYFIYNATLREMEKLREQHIIPDEEVLTSEDLFERNALLGDFSGDDSGDEEVRLGGILEDGKDRNGKGASAPGIRSGHARQESV